MTPRQHSELVHRIEYNEGEDLLFVVIETVAAISDASPADIGPINDVLDPEALCELFSPRADGRARAGGIVSFRFEGYRVEIDAGDRVVVVYK